MSKCTQKHYIMKEIVSNTLIGLLIRNHKLRTGSETFINPVKLFNVFLQVKINTFLPIHEKKISSECTILIFFMFFLGKYVIRWFVPWLEIADKSKEINVQCENIIVMQIDFSCHRKMHDWGRISAYLKEGIVCLYKYWPRYFRLEKSSYLSPRTSIDFHKKL